MQTKGAARYAISLSKAWSLSKLWLRTSIMWRVLTHIFAVGASAASFAVVYISKSGQNSDHIVIILSLLSALLTLVGFACNPTRYMLNYRAAFQILNDALIRNTDEEGRIIDDPAGYEAIRSAIIEGERLIDKTYEVE